LRVLTSIVGRPIGELDTPALIVDLDVLESNIEQMASDIASRGASWRPHSKANKSPAIGHRELRAGAIGITCAKLSEAEVLVANGIFDVLISNQVVGEIKTRRLAWVNRQPGVDVKCCVDSSFNVQQIAAAGREAGVNVRVLIEINSGMERAGVLPQDALALAKEIDALDGIEFAGLMTWEGHAMGYVDFEERTKVVQRSIALVLDAQEEIEAAGIEVGIVSVGGTGTYLISAAIEGVTEVQAGGGIWGDAMYLDLHANVKPALELITTVTSRPNPTRVIIDAGRKTCDPSNRAPIPIGIEIEKIALSAEHGNLTLTAPSETPAIGDRLHFRIGYSDQIMHLHEALYGHRNGIVEQVIPIAGRGRLQ
jgi:D-serine deaminase-like pyridoxal phosphate-dependent protein